MARFGNFLLSIIFPRKLFGRLGQLLRHKRMLYLCTLIWPLLYGWMAWRLWNLRVFKLDNQTIWQSALCVVLGVYVVLGWRSRAIDWGARFRPINTFFQRIKQLKLFNRVGKPPKWRPLTQAEMSVMDPGDFEAYIAERLFARMGYQVLDTPNVKDGGIDILLEDDRGAQSIVQCKRYSNTVGTPIVRDLYGTMIHSGAVYGYLVTSGRISADAHAWVINKPIGLIDGAEVERLAKVLADA
ncbi:MAG: restriction endonuclease [Caldilineaceae bacterium]